MTLYQWLCLLGIPTLLVAAFKYTFSRINGICKGVQALLRAQLVTDYNKWKEQEYAPIYARENFENCWQQYHALGKNGVMDDLHEKFFELPTEPPNKLKEDTQS